MPLRVARLIREARRVRTSFTMATLAPVIPRRTRYPGLMGILLFDRTAQLAVLALLIIAALVPVLNLAVPETSALHLGDSTVKVLGKYLTYAMLALALDLVWGFCGILSLGHAAFFALGGYVMGMHLMRLIGDRGEYGNPVLPDFMVFLNWEELPWFWIGLDSFLFTAILVVLVPGALAYAFGWFAFRSRVSGVYLSIITQAMTYALYLAFYRNEMGFGGNNGFTDFKEILGLPLSHSATAATTVEQVRQVYAGLYVASALALLGAFLLCRWVTRSKYGQVLTAVRDEEARVRFQGYPVERVKLFAWTLSAMIAGVAGALYVPQAGIINPEEFAPLNSIEAVVWVAVGGRGTLFGPILGAIGVKAAESEITSAALDPSGAWVLLTVVSVGLMALLSTQFRWKGHPRWHLAAIFAAVGGAGIGVMALAGVSMPAQVNMAEYWLFALGGLFALVTLVLPRGVAGLGADALAVVRRAGRAKGTPEAFDAPNGSHRHQALLYLDGVTVSFDGFKALNNLSLVMEPNELRAVIGPNGAGKTTMMDVITGKTRPDRGEAWFKGHINLLTQDEAEIARAGIGRKFQRPTVFPNQTVYENLALARAGSRHVWDQLLFKARGDVDAQIAETLETIGLASEAGRIAGELAHGQKQWLEIGMLLIQGPELMLIDEPAAGMTTQERAKTAEMLKRISQDHGVIVVEHDMDFVEMLDTKVTVLHEGSVLAEGRLDAVKANQRVKDVYLGR